MCHCFESAVVSYSYIRNALDYLTLRHGVILEYCHIDRSHLANDVMHLFPQTRMKILEERLQLLASVMSVGDFEISGHALDHFRVDFVRLQRHAELLDAPAGG